MTGTPLAAGLLLASGDQGDSPRWLAGRSPTRTARSTPASTARATEPAS